MVASDATVGVHREVDMNDCIPMTLWDIGVLLRIGMNRRRIDVRGRRVGMRGGICMGGYRIYMWHCLTRPLSKFRVPGPTCQFLVRATQHGATYDVRTCSRRVTCRWKPASVKSYQLSTSFPARSFLLV